MRTLVANSTLTADGSIAESVVVNRGLEIQSAGRPDFSIYTLAARPAGG